MYQTFNKQRNSKRRNNTHRRIKNKAGVNRVTHMRNFLTEKIGNDLTPLVLKPYAATRISRNYSRHFTRDNYAKDVITFYNNLIMFKNVLIQLNPVPAVMEQKRINLLNTIPVGRTVGAFLNKPYILYSINLLRTKLSNNFTFPQRGSVDYIQLLGLIDDILGIMKKSFHNKELPIPPIIERAPRIVSSPTEIENLALGIKYKSRRNKK